MSSSDDPTMFYGNVLVMHSGNNRNGSSLTEDAAKKAIKNLAYKPVLANFCEIDGVKDFTSHDFDIDENGEYVYYEKQIGCFTADKAYMEQDSNHSDRMNVFAKVAIPREYTDAAEIIERKNGTKVSVELAVNELSYSAKDHVLLLEDVDVMGLTCLGVNPDTGDPVNEGMEGAHIQIEDFSAENNSLVFNAEIINSIADAVAKRLSDKNDNQRKEDETVDFEEKNEEVVEETEVMSEEVETTEEEVREVDTETSEEVVDDTTEEVADETPEVVDSFADDDPVDNTDDNTDENTDDNTDDEEVVIDDDTLPPTYKKVVNGMEFELSLSDIQNAMYDLVNSTYAESDNDYYVCEIYQDSKSVVMIGMWSGKAFKQNYKVRNDVYSLVGDRVPVRASWLTADEEAELDRMRSNYSSVVDKLAKYESEPQKMDILNSDDYSQVANSNEFIALKDVDKHFDMTIDEVRSAADSILLSYAKGNKIDFAENEKKRDGGLKLFASKDKKKPGRYGNLFK